MPDYWWKRWEKMGQLSGRIVSWDRFRQERELMKDIENQTNTEVPSCFVKLHVAGVPAFLMKDTMVGTPGALDSPDGEGYVTSSSVEHGAMAWAIRKELEQHPALAAKPLRIVEVGGGFGNLAWTMCRATSVLSYTMIDHPYVLRIQDRYLQMCVKAEFARAGGGKELFIGNPSRPTHGFQFIDYRARWTRSAENLFDLAINTRSFGEMDQEEVEDYFALFAKVLRPGGLFYCLNWEAKRTRLESWPWQRDFELVWKRGWPRFLDKGPMFEVMAMRKSDEPKDESDIDFGDAPFWAGAGRGAPRT